MYFNVLWHHFDEFSLILTLFETFLHFGMFKHPGTCFFSELFERLRQARHLSASGGGVNITALNANSSNLPRNQNLRITQSDPSRRDSMSQARAILQIQAI